MTPLEAMARAFWGTKWNDLDDEEKDRSYTDMRAALLALARTELPCDAVAAGRNCAGASSETAQLSFIGICLTLAKQETTP